MRMVGWTEIAMRAQTRMSSGRDDGGKCQDQMREKLERTTGGRSCLYRHSTACVVDLNNAQSIHLIGLVAPLLGLLSLFTRLSAG